MQLTTKSKILDRGYMAPWTKEVTDEFLRTTAVEIIGVGNTGSWLGLVLSKMGVSFAIRDMDRVALHNCSTQVYGTSHYKRYKVDALIDVLSYIGVNLPYAQDYNAIDQSSRLRVTPIVCAMVDSMSTRKIIYQKAISAGTEILIDPRTHARGSTIYVVNMKNASQRLEYENSLFSDEEASEPTCGLKSTTFTGVTVAGVIGTIIANYFTNVAEDSEVASVPFKLDVNLTCLDFELTYLDNKLTEEKEDEL